MEFNQIKFYILKREIKRFFPSVTLLKIFVAKACAEKNKSDSFKNTNNLISLLSKASKQIEQVFFPLFNNKLLFDEKLLRLLLKVPRDGRKKTMIIYKMSS